MEMPIYSEDKCRRKLTLYRSLETRAASMSPDDRAELSREIHDFAEALSPSTQVISGAVIGLTAAVLPVIGAITGPLVGGALGAWKASQLAQYRHEALALSRRVAA